MRAFLLLPLLAACTSTWTALDGDGDGYTVLEGDCYDVADPAAAHGLSPAEVHPGAEDAWYDGVDANCDGADDYDADGDGFVADEFLGLATTFAPGTGELPGGDCWDDEASPPPGDGPVPGRVVPSAAQVNQAAVDAWYDGVDQDCQGDDDFDADGDGERSAAWPDAEGEVGADCVDGGPGDAPNPAGLDPAEINSAATETWYDGTDQDCRGDDDDDADADGWAAEEVGGLDCDDEDPTANPGALEEAYSGVDEDCDEATADGDADGDGFWAHDYDDQVVAAGGSPLAIPAGLEGDCWDLPGDPPAGFVAVNFEALLPEAVHPGAEERWYDGVDQDCAGDLAREFDVDLDGYASALWPDALGVLGDDCVDGGDDSELNPAGLDPALINPGAIETWYDGTDQDCLGDSDHDADGDGHEAEGYGLVGADDCDDGDPAVSPDATEDCATTADDNCDGDTNDLGALACVDWFLDADGDGYGAFGVSQCTCAASGLYTADNEEDCLDAGSYLGVSASAINPDAPETCNQVDDDCDGLVDQDDDDLTGLSTWYADDDGDGYGDSSSSTESCSQPTAYVGDDTDCDDSDEDINPGATEVCDAFDTDEDCNGVADDDDSGVSATGMQTFYTDSDGDGYGDDSTATTACDAASGQVEVGEDCDDTDATVYPVAPELCDGQLNDCVGTAAPAEEADDDGDTYIECSLDAGGWDGTGTVVGGDDCDDGEAAVNPGVATDAADGVDEDCDGYLDEDAVSVGDLVVTELMQAPSGASVEWIEVANVGAATLYLDGWALETTSGSLCISADAALSVAPGDRLLLCASGSSVGSETCDYAWQDGGYTDFSEDCASTDAALVLDDSAEIVELSLLGTVIDELLYDTASAWPGTTGVSAELSESTLTAADNDDELNWCPADAADSYDGEGNLGTPGAANTCP